MTAEQIPFRMIAGKREEKKESCDDKAALPPFFRTCIHDGYDGEKMLYFRNTQ